MLRQHAEDLNSGPLSKLSLLIRERQQLRKTYNEQWQQLQQELAKVGGLLTPACILSRRRLVLQGSPDPLKKWKCLTAGWAPEPAPASFPPSRRG